MVRLPDSRRKIEITNEVLKNPYIGFTSFQHVRDEALFSECKTTEGWMKEHYPVNDFVEQKGREQGFYPDTEIAYIRMLWRDFEPEEGVFDYTLTDEIFKKAAEKNQCVMFRLMPHTTRQNEDVPDWLKEQIECPERPDTARVKDSPQSPVFLEKFAKAIEAFGLKYDGRENFYAMDISITGAWGEGHGVERYSKETLKMLIDTYTRVFKKTHLMGQVSAPELVNYANKTRTVGLRADGLGDPDHMDWYLPGAIYKMKDWWQKAPVSFETFWTIGEWKKQGWNIDNIIAETLKWHISTINAKSSPIPHEWKDKIDEWLKKMGYRFAIRLVEYPGKVQAGDTVSVNLWIENRGVAPIYNKLPFELMLTNADTKYIFDTDTNACAWLPGDNFEKLEVPLPEKVETGEYSLWCRLGGGDFPTVKFASDTEHTDDGWYLLTKISLEEEK